MESEEDRWIKERRWETLYFHIKRLHTLYSRQERGQPIDERYFVNIQEGFRYCCNGQLVPNDAGMYDSLYIPI